MIMAKAGATSKRAAAELPPVMRKRTSNSKKPRKLLGLNDPVLRWQVGALVAGVLVAMFSSTQQGRQVGQIQRTRLVHLTLEYCPACVLTSATLRSAVGHGVRECQTLFVLQPTKYLSLLHVIHSFEMFRTG